MKIVLASTSRYRRAQLEAAGIPHEAIAPRFDEDHALALSPEEMVVQFARGKAESLSRPDAIVLGADQIPVVDGRVLVKPGSAPSAIAQLEALQGRTHELLTAVAAHDGRTGETEHRLVVHRLRMRALSRAQIETYVARDAPLDCAGAYRIEAAGALLFEEIEGPDPSAIVGLPLTAVAELLLRRGVDPLGDQW